MGPPLSWEFFANPESSNHVTDLEGLATSARTSFGIIELWQKQKSFDNPLVKAMVDRIVMQGPSYYSAIRQSAKTAQEGCSFAQDAIAYCKRLIRAEDSPDTLKSGLHDIQEIAKRAHRGSEEMQSQFKRVRVELFKISKDAPSGTTISQVEKDALSQFEQAVDDLNTLIQHVGSFADWWGEMKSSLMNLEEILPQLRFDGTNPFRTETVTERWESVHHRYVWYQRQISEVEDYYKNLSGEIPGRSNIAGSGGASVNKYPGTNRIENGKIMQGSGTINDVEHRVGDEERLGEAQNRQNARIEAQRVKEERAKARAEREAEENRALANEKMLVEKKAAGIEAKRPAQERKGEEKRLAEERRMGESEAARVAAERRQQEMEQQRADSERRLAIQGLPQAAGQVSQVPFPGEIQQPAEHTGCCCIIM